MEELNYYDLENIMKHCVEGNIDMHEPIEVTNKLRNKKVEILDVNVNKGWRISRLRNLPSIAVKSDFNLKFKVTSKSGNTEESPLQITVKTDVDDLGQWMMDIDMVSEKNE